MKAFKVAEYILWYLKEKHNKNISNLRLQKYLFFCQYNEIVRNKKLLFDDDFVIWYYGPVIKEVYYHYCINGALNIINVPKENPLKGYPTNAIDDMIDFLFAANLTLADLSKFSIREFKIVEDLWYKKEYGLIKEPILTAFSFKKFLLDRKEKR